MCVAKEKSSPNLITMKDATTQTRLAYCACRVCVCFLCVDEETCLHHANDLRRDDGMLHICKSYWSLDIYRQPIYIWCGN